MHDGDDLASSLYQQGLGLLREGRLDEAARLFVMVCEIDPRHVDAWCRLSAIHGQTGDLSAAGDCCRRALEIEPDHAEALLNLGNVLFAQGQHDQAAAHYRNARRVAPRNPAAHLGLANVAATQGRHDEAQAAYQAAIELDGNLHFAYRGLGIVRLNQGHLDKAVNCFKKAIHLAPNDPSSWNCLGIALAAQGQTGDALKSFHNAIQLKPDYVEAYGHAADALKRLERDADALDHYRRAAELAPASAEAHARLGAFHLDRGDVDAAIACLQRTLEIDPCHAAALNRLGQAGRRSGRFDSYMEHYRAASALLPEDSPARAGFMRNIQSIVPARYDAWLDGELKICMTSNAADYRAVTSFIAHHLKHKHATLMSADDSLASTDLITRFAADDILLTYLAQAINTDPGLEQLFTRARRALLLDSDDGAGDDELRATAALALQGYNNEYLLPADPTEIATLARLKGDIEALVPTLAAPTKAAERMLFKFGMYESLVSLECKPHFARWPAASQSDGLRRLLELTVASWFEEEAIKREIPAVTPIEDRVSRLVQSQYEENPYPRWLSIPKIESAALAQVVARLFPHFDPPAYAHAPFDMLIAGCGTGNEAIRTAMTYANARILAVDLSRGSLAYAARMARKYGIGNIQFMQGDILQLSALNRRFHFIECFGVLHHMDDPVQGWSTLAELLGDGGLMKIGLYSEIARKHIVAIRNVIATEGLSSSRDSVQALRSRILRGQLGDTVRDEMSRSYDFYSTSRCRDLLFHVQEQRFTVPRIAAILHDLGLDFIGFELGHVNTESLYRARFPDDVAMTDLDNWDRFEHGHPLTFSKCYEFWCHRP